MIASISGPSHLVQVQLESGDDVDKLGRTRTLLQRQTTRLARVLSRAFDLQSATP